MLCDLLKAGSSDLQYLLDLYEEHNIDVNDNLEEARELFEDRIDVNALIYVALSHVAQTFIQEQSEELFQRTGYSSLYPPDYEIITDFMASDLYFVNPEVQEVYEDWCASRRLTQEQQLMQRMRQ